LSGGGAKLDHDYDTPVLDGEGASDYARYMQTDVLLSLQRSGAEMTHRDELLFQTVHQSTELWLKLACYEIRDATGAINANDIKQAIRLINRASLAAILITDQLEMMVHLRPGDFQQLRPILGNGSGFESPGWVDCRKVSTALGRAFDEYLSRQQIKLIDIYSGSPGLAYELADALLDWDDRIAQWRLRHVRIAMRIIGLGAIGTKGTPVEQLTELIKRNMFPKLWEVRSQITLDGPLGDLPVRPASKQEAPQ